jgi:hypothetical protein
MRKLRTPRLSTDRPLAMEIWPYDFVYGVVQVKSKLTRSALSRTRWETSPLSSV